MPKKEPKHPLKSQAMWAAYLTILIGLLRLFGIVGANEQVPITIDSMDKPVNTSPINKDNADDVGLVGLGALMIKGRKEADTPIGKLLGSS